MSETQLVKARMSPSQREGWMPDDTGPEYWFKPSAGNKPELEKLRTTVVLTIEV